MSDKYSMNFTVYNNSIPITEEQLSDIELELSEVLDDFDCVKPSTNLSIDCTAKIHLESGNIRAIKYGIRSSRIYQEAQSFHATVQAQVRNILPNSYIDSCMNNLDRCDFEFEG